MKKVFFALILFATLASCKKATEPEDYTYKHFQIKVDEITAPEKISLGDTLQFNLLGMIGGSSCEKFDYSKEIKTSLSINLTLMGKSPVGGCLDHSSYLHNDGGSWMDDKPGKTFKTLPKNRGDFTITINQPDGSKLEQVVKVE